MLPRSRVQSWCGATRDVWRRRGAAPPSDTRLPCRPDPWGIFVAACRGSPCRQTKQGRILEGQVNLRCPCAVG